MEKKWWKEAVAYQIYVRSFNDSNKDGIGDLQGIIEKLDYIQALGVDVIYLNPINQSPNHDNGYDISNFREIMEEYGSLKDFKKLLKEVHMRGMRLIMDLVINHSSDEHPWFIESRKSKDNYYRDFYIWHKGNDGNPPNSWGSFFGGSAWAYDEKTGEYYLHIFSEKQPDFNWENENLRKEMHKMIQFWVDHQVDGFRIDAINHLAKNQMFPEGEEREDSVYTDFIRHVQNLPKVHEYIKEIKVEAFNNEVVLIGETGGISYHNAHKYTGHDQQQLDMTFHFDYHSVGIGEKPWKKTEIELVEDIKEKMSGWQNRKLSEGWCPLFFSNHDTTRTVSRLGDDQEYFKESAKMLATLQLTQRGTPFIYNGDEIGMTNAWGYQLEDYRDISVKNNYKEKVVEGTWTEKQYLKSLHLTSRDNSRTPMQWDDSLNAGFSEVEPWIPVNENYQWINVQRSMKEKDSILNYYKALIQLRKSEKTLVYGAFEDINYHHPEIYAYMRYDQEKKFLIVTNYSKKTVTIDGVLEFLINKSDTIVLTNYETIKDMVLQPYEARIYKVLED